MLIQKKMLLIIGFRDYYIYHYLNKITNDKDEKNVKFKINES